MPDPDRIPASTSAARSDVYLGISLAALCAIVRGAAAWVASLSADEGVVGLMSIDILSGRAPTVYWYGQQYMGTLENILAAPFVRLFGTTAFAVRIPSVAASALCVYLLYRSLAGHISRRAGVFVALLLIFSPAFFHDITFRARGGYGVTLPLAAGMVCLVLSRRTKEAGGAFLFGLLAGLAFWTNPQTLEVSLPLAVVVFLSTGAKPLAVCAVGAALGVCPVFVNYLSSGVFMRTPPIQAQSAMSVLAALPRRAVSVMGGAEGTPFAFKAAAGIGVSLFLCGGTAVYLFARRKGGGSTALDALLATPALGAVVLAVQGSPWAPQRYFYLIYFALAVVAGVGWAAIKRPWPAALLLSAAILVGGSTIVFHHVRGPFGEEYLSSREYAAVMDLLKVRDVQAVVTDYGVDYALMYLTDLEVKALPVPLGGSWSTRYPRALEARQSGRFAVVLYDQPAHERLKDHMKPQSFEEFLRVTGREAVTSRIGRLEILTEISGMQSLDDMRDYGQWALERFDALQGLLPIVNSATYSAPAATPRTGEPQGGDPPR